MSVVKWIVVRLARARLAIWVFRPVVGQSVCSTRIVILLRLVSIKSVKILAPESAAKTRNAESSITIRFAVVHADKPEILSSNADLHQVI